jgi:ferric-dicitrate binding protein FerR (iron transport regulator)
VENKKEIVVDDKLIARYLSGEAQPEEAEALIDWLEEPFNLAHFEKIQGTWNATFPSKGKISFNKDSAWDTLRHKFHAPLVRSSFPLVYKIAATLIIGISVGLLGFYLLRSNNTASQISVVTLKSPKTITLPDNSTVVVNRNSTISYPEGFTKDSREVEFSGEGFFSIKGDVSKPFIVHTPVAHIKVVGTEFNVSSTNGSLEVNVQEGKVLVYTSTDSVYIEAGHSASLKTGTPIEVVNVVDANKWGYATRKFDFQDVPLADVFESIEKSYPYTIEVVNKDIKNCRLTASFDHVSAREMLNLISETLDLTIQENDSTFRVDGKGCPWVQ